MRRRDFMKISRGAALLSSATARLGAALIPADANGTIRFTYSPVLGYSPKDAVQ